MHTFTRTWVGLALLLGPGGAPDDASTDTGTLQAVVERYFLTEDPAPRAELVRRIEALADGDIAAVTAAMRGARLWHGVASRSGTFPFEPSSGRTVTAAFDVPEDYDPAHAYPVIVCEPGPGFGATETLSLARSVLGDTAAGHILVAPPRAVDGAFRAPREEVGAFRALVRATRRALHTDTDATFLFGLDAGADAAWHCAFMHGDLLAGLIAVNGRCDVPYPNQVYPFFLENLRSVRVLAAWSTAGGTAEQAPDSVVAAHNRAIVALAERMSLPVTGLALGTSRRDWTTLLAPHAADVLAHRRTVCGTPVSHWFRYPGQGHGAWLSQTVFKGAVWEADQLSILASPVSDRDTFITDVIQSKLAYVGGRIKGQSITMQTRRCAEVALRLPAGCIDVDKPVAVVCNGLRRGSRRIRPSIATLLSVAYEDWDVQNPVPATLSLRIRSDAKR